MGAAGLARGEVGRKVVDCNNRRMSDVSLCAIGVVLFCFVGAACGTNEETPTAPAPSESRVEPEALEPNEVAEAAPEEVQAEPESEPAEPPFVAPPFVAPPASQAARRALRRLAATLEGHGARETPGMREYLQRCFSSEELLAAKMRIDAADEADVARDPADQELLFEFYEACRIGSMIARDAGGSWVAIDVDIEESGSAASVVVKVGDSENEREVFRLAGLGPGDAARLFARSRRGRWGTTDNRVRAVALDQFSLNTYAALVEIGGVPAVEGMRIFVYTVANLDRPEYVLVAQARGEEPVELARREAHLGPCDGDGWHCDSSEAEEGECDAAALRAENRLCVLPLGISRVAVHDDAIAVQGSVNVAGHGGYPPFHWFARLPAPAP